MTTSGGEQGSFRSVFRVGGGWIVRALFNLGLGILYLLLLWSVSIQIQPGPDPQFEYPIVNTQERCEAEGGRWVTDGEVVVKDSPRTAPVVTPEGKPQPYCQGPLRIEREREAQQREADRVSFFVFVVGGVIALVGAIPLMKVTPVAPAFLIAGVIGLLISTGKLWQFAGSLARLLTILALLVFVATAGTYFFREKR